MSKAPMLIGLPGAVLTAEDKERLTRINPWGVILFARNYENTVQIKKLIREIKELIGQDTEIALDHEGGRVVRFPEALPELPAPRLFGEENDPKKMYEYSKRAAEALSDWGITINLAPVVDIFMETSHKRMLDRCFGGNPELVATMAKAFIKGMHDGGVKATAKHFPGIGPAAHDTHERGTVINMTKEEMSNQLWHPFRETIAAGVDAVMITHGTYTHLDPDLPATLSRKIITDILRNEFGFKGLILSDDLEMGAIEKHYNIEQAVEMSMSGGCDIACICLDVKSQDRGFDTLCNLK
ncbi:beta-N-acetylhexosaminidase [Candidatus Uabimicrobium sp. HlEnr_7]|uniref:beta-N-acetylhexosaminidase n=1 Tax=Candidatus Uabimicrobium helgolandensis TaxID=3095367 RepID=UPI003557B55B